MIKGRWTIFILIGVIVGVGMLAFPGYAAFVDFIYPPEKDVRVSRSFEPSALSTVGEGGIITVTVSVTNTEGVDLHGFYYSDQVPDGWGVGTESVRVDGSPIVDYAFEQGSDDVYSGYTPHRWALETPQGEGVFSPTHPIPASGGTAQIVYRMVVNGGTGSDYSAERDGWAGWLDTDPAGTAIFGYQEVVETLEADFTAAPRSGLVPLTVEFADTSTGEILTRTWDFGDGGTAQLPGTTVPPHTYTYSEYFTVSLTVQDAYTSDTMIRPRYIHATEVVCTVYLPVILKGQAP